MSGLFSRRRMIGVGGAVALSPLALARTASALDPTGPLTVLITPVRLWDSRTDAIPLSGQKLVAGESVAVTVAGDPNTGFAMAAFLNITVTQTEGAGWLRVNGSDLSGERPEPPHSNINWSTAN